MKMYHSAKFCAVQKRKDHLEIYSLKFWTYVVTLAFNTAIIIIIIIDRFYIALFSALEQITAIQSLRLMTMHRQAIKSN